MVKITYDLDNKEEVKFVEDYFFFKDFVEEILDEWKQYKDVPFRLSYSRYSEEEQDEIVKIITSHLNPILFNDIKCIFLHTLGQSIYNDFDVIELIFNYNEPILKSYKYTLIRKFGDKK